MIYTLPESYDLCSGGAPAMRGSDGQSEHIPRCRCLDCGRTWPITSPEIAPHHRLGHRISFRGVVQQFTEFK